MTDLETLRRGRKSFEQRAWSDSHRLLTAADRDGPLEPEDLERLATAAYLLGRDDESEAIQSPRASGIPQPRRLRRRRAVGRVACLWTPAARRRSSGVGMARQSRTYPRRGAARLAVRGYLLVPSAIQCIVQGDAARRSRRFNQAAEIASRLTIPIWHRCAVKDVDAPSSARKHREGVALLDEAMVALIAGEVAPFLAGDIYCSVLEGVRRLRPSPRVRVDDVSCTMVRQSA